MLYPDEAAIARSPPLSEEAGQGIEVHDANFRDGSDLSEAHLDSYLAASSSVASADDDFAQEQQIREDEERMHPKRYDLMCALMHPPCT